MIGDELFLAEGAQSSCGSLILKNEEVGNYRDNVFIPTPRGRELALKLSQITDVVSRPAKSKKKPEVADTPEE